LLGEAHIGLDLTLGAGSIESSSGTISFDNENLSTTGTFGAGAITGTSFIIGANTLTTAEWAYLDGQDQAVKTTSDVTFDDLIASTATIYKITGNLLTIGYNASNNLTWTTNSTGLHTLTLNSSGTAAQYGIVLKKGTPGLTPPAATIDALSIREAIPDTYTAGRTLWVHAERSNTGNLDSTYTTYALNGMAYARGSANLAGIMCGGRYGVRMTGSGTLSDTRGVSSIIDMTALTTTGVVTSAVNYYSEGINAGRFCTITSAYGLYIAAHLESGSAPTGVITTTYGIYLADQTVGATNYGIYQNGTTGLNIFNANTRIGGTTAPVYACDVTGEVNATTGYRINGTAGATGTFTTVDLKTVTVTNGIITSIV
jgi:hypothetical protein